MRRRRRSSGSTLRTGRSSLRLAVNTGRASRALRSVVTIASRITSGLTLAPTSSMNDTAAKATRKPPVAGIAQLAEAPDPVAGCREHQGRNAHGGAAHQIEQEAGGEARGAAG